MVYDCILLCREQITVGVRLWNIQNGRRYHGNSKNTKKLQNASNLLKLITNVAQLMYT